MTIVKLLNMTTCLSSLAFFWITFLSFTDVNAQNHAFIQIDSELKYLVDGVTVHMSDMVKSGSSSGGGAEVNFMGRVEEIREHHSDDRSHPLPHKNYIVFDPPHLDFKQHPVGMPVMRKVVVRNMGPYPGTSGPPSSSSTSNGGGGESVHLHSLSGNTLHFHCTFFQDKVVPVHGNTTFDVVFLGREEGLIENTIFIHSSVGTYKYAVRAVGTSNPYRLRPLVGVRMPLNSSYTPLINLHNPHPYTLQVRELYSSGGDLHLELMGGAVEGVAHQWSIPPYRTQPLIRANFVARRENNHTAYIRIVTTGAEGDYLVVPVEVEVSSEAGLFCPHDSLHFGLLTPHDPPATLPLLLLNSAHKHIHIQNVITTPVNDAISIDFKPLKIPPGTVKATQVATVTFDPSKVKRAGAVTGKLLIKSKVVAYKLTVPFTVNMYHGHLHYQPSITSFYTGPPELDPSVWAPGVIGYRASPPPDNSSSTPSSPFISSSHNFPSSSLYTLSSSSLSWSSSPSSLPSPLSLTSPPPPLTPPSHDRPPPLTTASSSASSTFSPPTTPLPSRNLSLSNSFPCPVVVYNVTLPPQHHKHFKVVWWGEVVLPVGGEDVVAALELLSVGSYLRLHSLLTVHTNITTITIPITAYNGRLTMHFSTEVTDWDSPQLLAELRENSGGASAGVDYYDNVDGTSAPSSSSGATSTLPQIPEDLGTVGVREQRQYHFYVMNENPVPLRLHKWECNVTWSRVDLMAVFGGERNEGEAQRGPVPPFHDVWLSPQEIAVFRLSVLTPGLEGVHWGVTTVTTHHETLSFVFKLRTAVGQLAMLPSPVLFNDAHPGKVSSVPLEVRSTFGHSMKVKNVVPLGGSNGQFWYRGAPDGDPYTLLPDTVTSIGSLQYDPQVNCGAGCYVGFSLTEKLGQQWSGSLSLSGGHVASTDTSLYNTLTQRYKNLSSSTYNTSLVLHTSHLHAFPFTAQVSLVWPRITRPHTLNFPLTQLHNTSILSVPVKNPSSSAPLFTQLLFLHQYPSSDTLLGDSSFLRTHIPSECFEHMRAARPSSEAFQLVDLEAGSTVGSTSSQSSSSDSDGVVCDECRTDPAVSSGLAQHKRDVEQELGVRVNKDTMVFRLGPGDEVDVRVSFRPLTAGPHCSMLVIRNNLTVFDTVLLSGTGGQGVLKFANRKPDSRGPPLTFNVASKHLKDCEAPQVGGGSASDREPKLSIKRTFTARNTGDLPVTVTNFLIAGTPCQGYGFKVMQCESFTLQANASRKIDIAFTPDFTLTKVQQELEIVTDTVRSQRLVYGLQAFIPASLLATCTAALPRPPWETLLYYVVLILLFIMVVATLVVAMMDADLLIKDSLNSTSAPAAQFDKDKVFDLKAMGQQRSAAGASTSTAAVQANGVVHDGMNQKANSNGSKNGGTNGSNHSKKSLLAQNSSNSNKYKQINKNTEYRLENVNNNPPAVSKAKEYGSKTLSSSNNNNECSNTSISRVGDFGIMMWLKGLFSSNNKLERNGSMPSMSRKKKTGSQSTSTASLPQQQRKKRGTANTRETTPLDNNSSESEASSNNRDYNNKRDKSKNNNKMQDCNNIIERRDSEERLLKNTNNNNNSDDDSSLQVKSSHKFFEEDEDSTSSTSESSNIEDLSASDKDASKSDSTCLSSQGSSSSNAATASSSSSSSSSSNGNNKCNSLGNKSTNNSKNSSNQLLRKKISKTRSQPAMSSSAPSNNTNNQDSAKTKANNKEPLLPITPSSPKDDDVGYEFAVRGKGNKRIKGVPVADLSSDQCLELPYSPKTVKPPIVESAASKRLIGKRKAFRVKSETNSSPSIPVTPHVSKAEVKPLTSSNTNVVAPNNAAPVITVTRSSTTSDPLSTSQMTTAASRDSYSSKVLGQDKQKAKVTPVGKILPEIKRVAPQRNLGAIGQKIATPPNVLQSSFASQQAPLSLFSSNDMLPYFNNSPVAIHSWDPKTVGNGSAAGNTNALLGSSINRETWPYTNATNSKAAQLSNTAGPPSALSQHVMGGGSTAISAPGMGGGNVGGGLWAAGTDLYHAHDTLNNNNNNSSSSALSMHTPLPNTPGAPWDSMSSIWSTGNSNWAPPPVPSTLWRHTDTSAVSQGLGFDPFKTVGWAPASSVIGVNMGTRGWPAAPADSTSQSTVGPPGLRNKKDI